MPPPASTRKKDDFDMAKLQKSLQQRRRHSLSTRPQVAKLTPAEIRSLNNSASASKIGSQQSSNRNSLNSHRQASNSTPPTTPDDYNSSAYQAQVSRSSSVNLPTPPHSPNLQHRRASHSSVQNGHPRHGSHIHAPTPRHAAQAGFVSHGQSRPSSTTGNFNPPMYRGHEVTRTGSKNMLQQPAQKIVTNPLSMYSRPRQSLVQSSPDRQRREDFPEVHSPPEKQPWEDFPMMDAYQAELMLSADDVEPEGNMTNDSIKAPSPSGVVESPVSFDAKHSETQNFPVVEKKASPETTADPGARPTEYPQVTSSPSGQEKTQLEEQNKVAQMLYVKDPQNGDASTSKDTKKPKKRFTFRQGFFEPKDKGKVKDKNASAKVLKKNRRNTVSFTKSTDGVDDTTNGMEANDHDEQDGLMNGHSSDSAGNEEFPSNPAVRPLSSGSDSVHMRSRNGSKRSLSLDDFHDDHHTSPPTKAKSAALTPLSIPSRPVYGRCACCGKLKRPAGGYASGLSPVLENEHIRSNFSFEAQRNNVVGSASSSHDKKRHTAIIPMEVHEGDAETGSIRTVQASIAPYDSSIRSPSRMSSDTSMSGAIGEREKKRRSESATEQRIVRFSSLHGLKALADAHFASGEDNEVIEDSTPVVERNGKMERELVALQGVSRPESQISSQYSSPLRPDSGFGFRQNQSDQSIEAAPEPTQYRKSMPKQDVINVVGWDRGRRAEDTASPVDHSTPQVNDETIEPNDSASAVVSPISPAKETSKEDKKKSRVSGILKVLQPRAKEPARTLSEEEMEAKMKKKRTSRMSVTSPAEEAQDAVLSRPQMSPTDKENHRPGGRDQVEEASIRQPGDFFGSKFSQYDAPGTRKMGHAPQLSLHLDQEEGGLMGLSEPSLGVHFATTSNRLRDLVVPNAEKTAGRDRTPERDVERMLYDGTTGDGSVEGYMASGEQEKAMRGIGMHDGHGRAMRRGEENEMDKHRGKVAAESGVLEKKYLKTKSGAPWFGIGDLEGNGNGGKGSGKSRESVMKNMASLETGVWGVEAR